MTAITKYVGAGVEATYGTAVAATVYENIRSETMKPLIEYSKRGGAGYAVETAARASKEYSGGDLVWVPTEGGILHTILYNLFGSYTDSGTAYTYLEHDSTVSHTFRCGRETHEHIFPGCVVERLELACRAGDYLVASTNLLGKKKDANGALGTPSFDTTEGYHANDMTVTCNSATITGSITDISIVFTRNHDQNEIGGGSTEFQRRPKQQRYDISGSLNVRSYDSALETLLKNAGSFVIAGEWETTAGEKLTASLTVHADADNASGINERNVERHGISFFGVLDQGTGKASTVTLTH